jgi:hypothetical protein
MTFPQLNDISDRVRNAEETLRLIATLPAPHGLSKRVQARLAATPPRATLTNWHGFSRNGWMFTPVLRGFAAAAIVLVVAGGGFAIFSRIQPSPSANAVEQPARIGNGGAFAGAGAMRKPETLNGPVLTSPVVPEKQKMASPALPSPTPAPQSKPAIRKKKAADNALR